VTADLSRLRWCFEGAVPAVLCTASADGVPNVTYLSKVRAVDDEHIALSNQFFSKTVRNLAENPRASMLLVDPITYDEFRLQLRYERTVRSGELFTRLREDVDTIAEMTGMQDVFRLRGADIYRVEGIEHYTVSGETAPVTRGPLPRVDALARIAELSSRLGRCTDLDTLVGTTVDGLADVLGYEHSLLMLLDESGKHLYTIASHGYDDEGIGSEVAVGEGSIGMAAARATTMRVTNLRQMRKYAQSVRRSYEGEGLGPGREIPLPGLADAESRVAVPLMALGQVVGVLMVESPEAVAFDESDDHVLATIASIVANAVETERVRDRTDEVAAPRPPGGDAPHPGVDETHVRFFPVDGSTFLDGDYLIKGVAGRILWSLLLQHRDEGRVEFSNREARLDPSLELPQFRDNFESRLILLKRRLDERAAPVRIEKSGRGRFRLVVDAPLRLESL
jgi:adenylate cyclase